MALTWRSSSKNRFAEDGVEGTAEVAGGRGGDPDGGLGGVVVGDDTADGGLEHGGERELHVAALEDARPGA